MTVRTQSGGQAPPSGSTIAHETGWPAWSLEHLTGPPIAVQSPWPALDQSCCTLGVEIAELHERALEIHTGVAMAVEAASPLRAFTTTPRRPPGDRMKVVLLGRTLAGKSTLFAALSGLHGDRVGDTSQRFSRDAASAVLKKFNEVWGAGSGIRKAAGSPGHKVVLEVGHAAGKKFKPWEAARMANNIGRAARVGGVVIALGAEAYAVYAEERDQVREERARATRRRTITQKVLAQCDELAAGRLQVTRAVVDQSFRPQLDEIDLLVSSIHQSQQSRSQTSVALGQIEADARAMLAELARG